MDLFTDAKKSRRRCRHCRMRGVPLSRDKRLCRDCHGVAEVRERYSERPAAAPCGHLPGSKGRIETLRRRVRSRSATGHPGDLTWEEYRVWSVDRGWPVIDGRGRIEPRERKSTTGVERAGNQWRVRPRVGGEKVNLGRWDTEGEAEQIALGFWLWLLGLDFAVRNEPDRWIVRDPSQPITLEEVPDWLLSPAVRTKRAARAAKKNLAKSEKKSRNVLASDLGSGNLCVSPDE